MTPLHNNLPIAKKRLRPVLKSKKTQFPPEEIILVIESELEQIFIASSYTKTENMLDTRRDSLNIETIMQENSRLKL